MNITVSGYNRPEYLGQTLTALRACEGIDSCRVAVLLDPSDETVHCAALAARYGFECFTYSQRVGCNNAIRYALAYGFEQMGGEFHLHLEDDTVPTRDALRWFAWARDAYRDHARVMNVSGYQRVSNGRTHECGARRWFTPWGMKCFRPSPASRTSGQSVAPMCPMPNGTRRITGSRSRRMTFPASRSQSGLT